MATEREEYETIEGLADPFDAPDSADPEAPDLAGDFTDALDGDDDPRLASGVPENAHSDELDFIEMTGLTRPAVEDAPEPEAPEDDPEAYAVEAAEPEPEPEPEAPRAPAVEAADAFDDEDLDDPGDDVVARALEALAAAPVAPPPPPPAPVADPTASKVRDELLEGLREDLSALRPAPVPVPTPAPEPAPEPSPVLEEEPAEPPEPVAPTSRPTLEEAERLVHELQEQPRDATPPPRVDSTATPTPEPKPAPADAPVTHERRHGERRSLSRLYAERHRDVEGYLAAYEGEPAKPESDEPEVEVDFSNDPPKHRHRTLTKKQRTTRRFLVAAFVLVLVASLGYTGYQYAEPYLQTATTLFREAEQLEVSGKAREASNRYRAFLTRYPNDPRAPDALFRAGFVLQVEDSAPVSPRALSDSISLFESFIAEYPNHDKVHRARTLRGILLHRTGQHEQAVTVLRDPALHLADPAAALPVWRTLAAAYEAMGDVDSARSEYLKAASYQGNYGADEDLESLAKMYRRLAEKADDPAERAELLAESIGYFQQASLVAGISRDRLQQLQRDMEFIRREHEDLRRAIAGNGAVAPAPPPAYLRMLEDERASEPAIEPGDAVSVLDGLDTALPGAGLDPAADEEVDDTADEAIDSPAAAPEPGVSADPVFDDSADETREEDASAPEPPVEEGLPDETPLLQ